MFSGRVFETDSLPIYKYDITQILVIYFNCWNFLLNMDCDKFHDPNMYESFKHISHEIFYINVIKVFDFIL